MRYYIEAYYADDRPILGNLDGQASMDVKDPYRTHAVRHLYTLDRPHYPRVAYWRLVDANDKALRTIPNPHHKE